MFDAKMFDDRAKYEALQDALMHEFGDEGHDIGDAGDFDELIANFADGAPHDSYTPDEMTAAIARFANADPADVRKYIDARLEHFEAHPHPHPF